MTGSPLQTDQGAGAGEEDRRNGPGWNDWLYNEDGSKPEPWRGPDGIQTGRYESSRVGWWRLVCTRLNRDEGSSLDQLVQDQGMWWFHLRLTREEIATVLHSAYDGGAVEPRGGGTVRHVRDDPDLPWKCTQFARDKHYTTRQTGAGARDSIPTLFAQAGPAKKFAEAALPLIGGALTALGVLKTDADEVLAGGIGLIAAVVLFSWLVALEALRKQKILTAMMRSWPRAHDYRPARKAFELYPLRTPGWFALFPVSVALGIAASAALAHSKNELSDTSVDVAYQVAAVIGGAAVIAYAILKVIAERRRGRWRRELHRRANPPLRESDVLR